MTKRTHNIFSFNMLSACMGNSKYFKDSEFLDFHKGRSDVLVSQFASFNKDSIICFQEWGLSESVAFNNYFTSNNYFLFTTYCGLPERDYNGVAIAIPITKYTIISMGRRKTADMIPNPPKNVELSKKPNVPNRILPDDLYVLAKQQPNEVCWVVLEENETGEKFIVFNYHLPCIFYWRAVMNLHANALRLIIDDVSEKFKIDKPVIVRQTAENLNSFKRGSMDEKINNENCDLPIVLCGDFNAELFSSTYDLMVNVDLKIDLPYLEWKPDTFKRNFIDSRTYVEGDYTTNNILPDGRIFEEVIDYIFVSNFHTIKNEIHKTDEIAPNKNNGSDHFPIEATLSFKEHVQYYVEIGNDYRSGPWIRISQEEMEEYYFIIELYFDEGKTVKFYDLMKDNEVLSIPYTTKEEGKKIMQQIYAKCNGFLPFVVTGMTSAYKEEGHYPKVGDLLDDAPEEILNFEFKDDWCFCLMTDGIKIEESLIVRPCS